MLAIVFGTFPGVLTDASILKQHIQSPKTLRFLGELLDAVVVLQVELPHLYHAGASCGRLDITFGSLALVDASACNDDLFCVEADEVPCCFFTESNLAYVSLLPIRMI